MDNPEKLATSIYIFITLCIYAYTPIISALYACVWRIRSFLNPVDIAIMIRKSWGSSYVIEIWLIFAAKFKILFGFINAWWTNKDCCAFLYDFELPTYTPIISALYACVWRIRSNLNERVDPQLLFIKLSKHNIKLNNMYIVHKLELCYINIIFCVSHGGIFFSTFIDWYNTPSSNNERAHELCMKTLFLNPVDIAIMIRKSWGSSYVIEIWLIFAAKFKILFLLGTSICVRIDWCSIMQVK
jgi:hypothetical protein